MYKLIYCDKEDGITADIEFTIPSDPSISEMCEYFDRFLKAAGYYPPENATLEYVVEEQHGRNYE